MHVGDGLPGGGAAGLKDHETRWRERRRHGAGNPADRVEQGVRLARIQIDDRFDMGLDADDDVARHDLIDVEEGDGQVVLVDPLRRDPSRADLAEHTVASHGRRC